MKMLHLLFLVASRRYYQLALSHDPMHPDIPRVVRRRAEIKDALARYGF